MNNERYAEMEKLQAFNLESGSMKHYGILKQNISFQNRLHKVL